ncbi:hypothetical protein BOTBODRAFT_62810 [Botryobasidium botryosum FD-172 SS1]|uniref:Uncharacterized protein n=1 Tax=Botryobasidium botryosum (strain FD-172 SS1) TaxID=930990 RepID=A0A067MXK3_BOTB1|nr:hypothetical protein BOTBODRAFT_62810 [Botryobasidium botryosum FD-172 SS1]
MESPFPLLSPSRRCRNTNTSIYLEDPRSPASRTPLREIQSMRRDDIVVVPITGPRYPSPTNLNEDTTFSDANTTPMDTSLLASARGGSFIVLTPFASKIKASKNKTKLKARVKAKGKKMAFMATPTRRRTRHTWTKTPKKTPGAVRFCCRDDAGTKSQERQGAEWSSQAGDLESESAPTAPGAPPLVPSESIPDKLIAAPVISASTRSSADPTLDQPYVTAQSYTPVSPAATPQPASPESSKVPTASNDNESAYASPSDPQFFLDQRYPSSQRDAPNNKHVPTPASQVTTDPLLHLVTLLAPSPDLESIDALAVLKTQNARLLTTITQQRAQISQLNNDAVNSALRIETLQNAIDVLQEMDRLRSVRIRKLEEALKEREKDAEKDRKDWEWALKEWMALARMKGAGQLMESEGGNDEEVQEDEANAGTLRKGTNSNEEADNGDKENDATWRGVTLAFRMIEEFEESGGDISASPNYTCKNLNRTSESLAPRHADEDFYARAKAEEVRQEEEESIARGEREWTRFTTFQFPARKNQQLFADVDEKVEEYGCEEEQGTPTPVRCYRRVIAWSNGVVHPNVTADTIGTNNHHIAALSTSSSDPFIAAATQPRAPAKALPSEPKKKRYGTRRLLSYSGKLTFCAEEELPMSFCPQPSDSPFECF